MRPPIPNTVTGNEPDDRMGVASRAVIAMSLLQREEDFMGYESLHPLTWIPGPATVCDRSAN